jgi:hypothetical protein
LANGLRRRAQSLNFAIRSNQSAVDSTRQSTLPLPAAKRRRKEPINNHSLSAINSSQRVTSRSKLLSQKIIQTRKKSASVVINNDLSSKPQENVDERILLHVWVNQFIYFSIDNRLLF